MHVDFKTAIKIVGTMDSLIKKCNLLNLLSFRLQDAAGSADPATVLELTGIAKNQM